MKKVKHWKLWPMDAVQCYKERIAIIMENKDIEIRVAIDTALNEVAEKYPEILEIEDSVNENI